MNGDMKKITIELFKSTLSYELIKKYDNILFNSKMLSLWL